MPSANFYTDSEKLSRDGTDSDVPLIQDDFAQLKDQEFSTKRLSFFARVLIGFVAVILVFLAVFLIVFWKAQQAGEKSSKLETPDRHYCGTTSEEAISRGCHYESMLSCWIPDTCYTSQPTEGYDPYSELNWFSDPEIQHPLTDEEMAGLRSGNFTRVWTTWEYHLHHCLYTWRKLATAMEYRIPYTDSRTAEFGHSQHCANIVTDYVYDHEAYLANSNKTGPLQVKRTMLGCVKLF